MLCLTCPQHQPPIIQNWIGDGVVSLIFSTALKDRKTIAVIAPFHILNGAVFYKFRTFVSCFSLEKQVRDHAKCSDGFNLHPKSPGC